MAKRTTKPGEIITAFSDVKEEPKQTKPEPKELQKNTVNGVYLSDALYNAITDTTGRTDLNLTDQVKELIQKARIASPKDENQTQLMLTEAVGKISILEGENKALKDALLKKPEPVLADNELELVQTALYRLFTEAQVAYIIEKLKTVNENRKKMAVGVDALREIHGTGEDETPLQTAILIGCAHLDNPCSRIKV